MIVLDDEDSNDAEINDDGSAASAQSDASRMATSLLDASISTVSADGIVGFVYRHRLVSLDEDRELDGNKHRGTMMIFDIVVIRGAALALH